jgi:hypothetical protein
MPTPSITYDTYSNTIPVKPDHNKVTDLNTPLELVMGLYAEQESRISKLESDVEGILSMIDKMQVDLTILHEHIMALS